MFEFANKTDSHVVIDDCCWLRHHQSVVCGHVIRDKVVVGEAQLQAHGGLLVSVMDHQNVLVHPKMITDTEMVDQGPELSLLTEINDGNISAVEFVQDICFSEVKFLKLDVVDNSVRNARADQLYVLKQLFSFWMKMALVEINDASNVQLWSGPVGDCGLT